MFAGTGGSGVKSMPSEHSKVMPKKCVICHMHKEKEQPEKTEGIGASMLKGGHTFRPDDKVCLECHKDPGALVAEWQAEISPLLEQLEAALEDTPDKKSRSYRTARANYNLVRADGGTGMHNPRYAAALLQYSISSLKIGSVWEQTP